MARWIALALASGMLFASCSTRKAAADKPAESGKQGARPAGNKMIVTPAATVTGRIVKANNEAKFVVISFPLGHLPGPDQRLSVYRAGLKTGEVKITGPQRDDKIVADIVAGEAAVGDETRND